MTHTGKIGESRDIAYGQAAARVVRDLPPANEQSATLRISRIVQLNGFVNSIPGFADSPAVINGASDTLVKILATASPHPRRRSDRSPKDSASKSKPSLVASVSITRSVFQRSPYLE